MNSNHIDLDFIDEWEKVYDSHESDENDYKQILERVATELFKYNSITKETFIRLISWKSLRLKGIIKLNEFETTYKPVISHLKFGNEPRMMLRSLVSQYGIGIPVASTILHFVHPETFPIIDIRTTESLNHFGLWSFKTITEDNYWLFFDIITKIKIDTGRTLRKIDRALFSFHKVYLKGRTRSTIKKQVTISALNPREKSKIIHPTTSINSLENYVNNSYRMTLDEFSVYLANKYINDIYQKEIFLKQGVWMKVRLNYIAGLILTLKGKYSFTPKELREIVVQEIIPSISSLDDLTLSGLILTQDVHEGANKLYNNGYFCLMKISRGKYKFIGFR